jgi:hypothetical protein
MLRAIELLSDQLPVPSQDRIGFGYTSDFPQGLPPDTLSDLGQGDALRIGQPQSGRKSGSEDPVFRRQILILQEQFLIHRTGHIG